MKPVKIVIEYNKKKADYTIRVNGVSVAKFKTPQVAKSVSEAIQASFNAVNVPASVEEVDVTL